MQNNGLTIKPRSSNFELLRVVCMLFIIIGHMIMWHKFNNQVIQQIVSIGIRPFFMVAVNCFVLISGWFGIKYNIKKVGSLCLVTMFWTFILCLFAYFIGIHGFNITKDIVVILAPFTKQYWFITIYIVLCILAPYLNVLIEHLSQKQYKSLLTVSIVLFVIWPTIAFAINAPSITEDAGYGIVNFILLYLLGRYLRLYNNPQKSAWAYFIAYTIIMILCGATQIMFSKILGFKFTSYISYNTIFVFCGAIMLFCCFAQINFQNKVVNWLASFAFAVYILHIHPWTGKFVFENLIGLKNVEDWVFILNLLVLPIIVYLVCCLLDLVRKFIFWIVEASYKKLTIKNHPCSSQS